MKERENGGTSLPPYPVISHERARNARMCFLLNGRRMEVLDLHRGAHGVHVAAQHAAREREAEEDALAAGRIDGMVDGVIG